MEPQVPEGDPTRATPIGERIRSLAALARIDMRTVAELAGQSAGSVSALTGRTTNPGVYTLLPFARLFDVPLEWLVTGEGDGPDPQRVVLAVASAINAANVRRGLVVGAMRDAAAAFRGLSNDQLGELRERARSAAGARSGR